jgi:hypothetical protein
LLQDNEITPQLVDVLNATWLLFDYYKAKHFQGLHCQIACVECLFQKLKLKGLKEEEKLQKCFLYY